MEVGVPRVEELVDDEGDTTVGDAWSAGASVAVAPGAAQAARSAMHRIIIGMH
jgi:hypothetical protein